MSSSPFDAAATGFFSRAHSVHAFELSPTGTILACNAAPLRHLGVPRELIVGRELSGFLIVPDADRLRAELATPGRREEPILLNFADARHEPYTLECWLDVRPEGATVVGEPPLADDRRRQRDLLALSGELAVLARGRAKLAEAEAAARLQAEGAAAEKDRAIATITHELRQPLGPMRFALDILTNEKTAVATWNRSLAILDRQVGQLARLIEDLLDAVRLRERKVALNRTHVDLGALLRDIVESSRDRSAALELDVRLELPRDAPSAWVDAGRMTQVFSNLLDNAIKNSARGGSIRASLQVHTDVTSIVVRDTGRGIPPDVLPRVFELFAQAGAGERGGLGIGLAVARGIVTLHGGTIEARSAGVGQGAEFEVRLPLAERPVTR